MKKEISGNALRNTHVKDKKDGIARTFDEEVM